jgi:hypothetical protein
MDTQPTDELPIAWLSVYFEPLIEEIVESAGRIDERGLLQALVLAAAVVARELPSLDTARAIVRRRPPHYAA